LGVKKASPSVYGIRGILLFETLFEGVEYAYLFGVIMIVIPVGAYRFKLVETGGFSAILLANLVFIALLGYILAS